MLDAILGEVQRFATKTEFEDDVCLVAMTRQPQGNNH
jgi:serine phosphatase RsbU (regulator of sigma subunit)